MTLRHLLLPPIPGGSAVTVEHWYKQPHDRVTRGDPLLLVRTEQVALDLPVPVSGTLGHLHHVPGDMLQAGVSLATIEIEQPEASGSDHVTTIVSSETDGRRRITPLARKLAATHGYDLTTIKGSGYGGRIMRADIIPLQDHSLPRVSAGPSPVAPPLAIRSIPTSADIPVAMTAIAIDLNGALAAGRAALRPRRSVTLTPLICVAYAVSQELLAHRLLASEWSEAGLIVRGRSTLVIEEHGERRVVHDAAALSLLGFARALAQPSFLDETERSFTIRTSSAWWTETSLAPGAAATLAMGSPFLQSVVVTAPEGDRVKQQTNALLTLCYDARILTQTEADAFLCAVKRRVAGLH